MTTDLPWDLEERVKDAFVAYLANAYLADMAGGMPIVRRAYPSITVSVGESDNLTADAPFTGRRRMDVEVTITTEPLNANVTVDGGEALTGEEFHRRVKSAVLGAMMGNTLADDLNDTQPEGVAFSTAFPTRQTRGVDGKRRMFTTQVFDTVAQPQAIGG